MRNTRFFRNSVQALLGSGGLEGSFSLKGVRLPTLVDLFFCSSRVNIIRVHQRVTTSFSCADADDVLYGIDENDTVP
jgi:hypothetical protein